MKPAARAYTAEEKHKAAAGKRFRSLADVEEEIVRIKRSVKHNTRRVDVLRAIARDFQESAP